MHKLSFELFDKFYGEEIRLKNIKLLYSISNLGLVEVPYKMIEDNKKHIWSIEFNQHVDGSVILYKIENYPR